MANGVIDLKTADFDRQVARGVVLVDFWAPWCGPCRMQGPILEQVASRLAGRAVVAKVNVDEDADLAARFGIRSIPALLVFKDGRLARQFGGLTPAEALVKAVEEALTPAPPAS
jgi:thioredoxin 1